MMQNAMNDLRNTALGAIKQYRQDELNRTGKDPGYQKACEYLYKTQPICFGQINFVRATAMKSMGFVE